MDMIPLIDVSLVLLIFFMMTAAVSSGVFSSIATPQAQHQLASIDSDMYWLGIHKGEDKEANESGVLYSLGKDSDKQHYLVKPTLQSERISASSRKSSRMRAGKPRSASGPRKACRSRRSKG